MAKKQTDKKVLQFIETLDRCFLAGDVELNIKLDVQQEGNMLYVTDSRTKRKFRMTIESVEA